MHFSIQQFEILSSLYQTSHAKFESFLVLQQQITKSIAEGLEVSRVSIWELEENILHCVTLYDWTSKAFISQSDLQKKEYPSYFQILEKELAVVVNDVESNAITTDLLQSYLLPLGIKSLLDIPVRENGKLIGVVCCESTIARNWTDTEILFARSITDILRLFTVEYQRQITEQSLLENQEKFQFISENISDGIYIIENDALVFASKIYLEMIGMSEEEKHNLHLQDMFYLTHPEDKDKIKSIIYGAAAQKLPSIKYQFRCRNKNDDYLWREDIMNIHYDASGNAFRAVIIARDITLEKTLELENENRQKTVALQNKLLIDFYASHFHSTFQEKVAQIAQLAIQGLQIERVSYWEMEKDAMHCKYMLDCNDKHPNINAALDQKDIPKYIAALNNQIAIIADDVYHNDSTSELLENYLKPNGITDTLDVPVRVNGKFYGVLCCEHRDAPRTWKENDVSFARTLADYLSIAIEQDKRMQAELELSENQKKVEFISENTSDGIIIIENAKITYVSSTFSKLSGYSLDLLQNLSLEAMFSYIHPEDVEQMKAFIYQNLEQKNTKFNYEYRFLATDHNYYWREDSVSVIYKENSDEYSKYIIISRDIQQRKEAELKLIESEQQLRLIFENSTDGFVVIEKQMLRYISPSYRMFLGFDNAELEHFTTNDIFALIHPEDRVKVMQEVATNIANKVSTFTTEFRIKSKDGNYHWREDLANIIYNDEGSYSKYIINSRNIQERKEIEAQLIENEQQLRLITENTSDGVAVIEDGKLTYVSPSYSKLLGYDKNDYKQFSLQDIFKSIHPEDVSKTKQAVYDGLAKKRTEIKYEHRFKGQDGNYHWREDSANVIYGEDGHYTKYIVVTRDISARKEAEKEKNRLHKITEKQNEKLINFTHIVSHDIRSHTSNLSMILDLYEEAENSQEQHEYFNMLKQSTNKLSDTIFYLNETVAIQSGSKNEKTVLHLKKEIEKALVGINAIIKTNNADVTIEVEESIEIIATQSYLESIIFNLLTNAIKYKSPDRIPTIAIVAYRKEEEVILEITDNGIGIDLEKNKDKIFGMYKTFHGNPDAVGLGLFMVKNHMESMGGRIEVTSELGIGTTFKLYFI